ncbi:MAG: ABC transporter ATP-binding protein [Candidatus Methanomethylophilaceae archaeon]
MNPIEIEGLTKSYGGFKAIDTLDLKVKANSFTGFLGPNGAGKSTTIKILTNLIRASSGSAYLGGVDITKDPKAALASVGSVVETPEFYPFLTPRETMDYLGSINGMSKESIRSKGDELMHMVKMGEWVDKKIGKFSKGMRQRVALAQSLLSDPKILILDEPTSGLDPRGMVEMREILKGLRDRDITVFMSSHMLNEVEEICDRVALIEYGKLLIHDDVSILTRGTDLRRVEVQTVKDLSKGIMDQVKALPLVESVQLQGDQVMNIDMRGDENDQAELLEKLNRLGIKVYSMTTEGHSLESLYMDLVKESR